MTRFDRHLLARFLAASALLVGLLIVTFIVLDYVEYVDDFMDRGATLRQVFGTYYLHYVPEIVRLTSPLAVFLAAIYTTARLSQSMQLTALTMAGVSLYRYLLPLALAALAITAGMFAFNGYVVPRAYAVVLDFQLRYYADAPEEETSEVFRQTSPDGLLAVGFYEPEQHRGYRVALYTFALDSTAGASVPTRLTARLDASDMTWVDSLSRWRLDNAALRTFAEDGSETVREVGALDTALAVLPRDLARTERDAQRMTIPETRAYVEALRRAGASRLGRPLVEYHAKYAYPVANFFLVIVGACLAARRRKGGQAIQFGIGLLVAFAYLALQRVIEPFGYAEAIPPTVAAWLPHVVFALVTLIVLWRAPK